MNEEIKEELVATEEIKEPQEEIIPETTLENLSTPIESTPDPVEEVKVTPAPEEKEVWQELSQSSIVIEGNVAKIPIAKKGAFIHKKHGVVSFTDEDFKSIKENFNKQTLGFNPYPTYGHLKSESNDSASFVQEAKKDSVDAELKKGDTLSIEEENGILYAYTAPNSETLDLLRKNEYEYSSGEFIRNYVDKETNENRGTVLARYALTNSPFIPFRDAKIELFSENSSNCPENLTTFIVKLSNNVEQTINQPDTTPMPDPILNDGGIETNAELHTEDSTSNVEATPSQSNLASIVDSITQTIKAAYEAKYSQVEAKLNEAKTAYNLEVEALKGQLEEIKGKFATQEAVTQKFSQSLTEAQKAKKFTELTQKGVSPALIQKFSLIQESINSNQDVIKLSDSEGQETEVSVLAMIESLLVESVGSEVTVEQLGQSLNESNLSTDFQKIKARYTAKKEALK
jgi:hypothetical protein